MTTQQTSINTPQSAECPNINDEECGDTKIEDEAPNLRERSSTQATVNRVLNGSKGGPLLPAIDTDRNHYELISQAARINEKRYRIKSSSFNGMTFQQLQMQRIENQAAAERHKLLRAQQSKSRHLDIFLKNKYIPTPKNTSETNGRDKMTTHLTTLPAVTASTKRELLRLNKRYASSISELSHNNESDDRTHQFISDPIRLDYKKDDDEASSSKLILGGINSDDSVVSHFSAMATREGRPSVGFERDRCEEAVDGDYLLHLEQLARDSSRLYSSPATGVAFEVDDDDSTSSSYDSPAPQLQTASACDSHVGNDEGIGGNEQNQCKLDDPDSNYFSCLCKAHVLISEGGKNDSLLEVAKSAQQSEPLHRGYETSKNEMLSKIASCVKHGMIIVGLALMFASLELVQEKISNWYRGVFHCMSVSVSRVAQKLSFWVGATRLSLSDLSPLENQSVRVMSFGEGYFRNQAKFLSRIQYISSGVWRRLRIVFLQWAEDIDFTTIAVETWFRIVKLQLECQLFLVNIMERLQETSASTNIAWNTTVAMVSSAWREFILNPPTSYTNERIILPRSKYTIPIDFPFNLDSSFDSNDFNQTFTMEPPIQKVMFCSKSSISFLKAREIPCGSSFPRFRAPQQLNSHSLFRHPWKSHHVYHGSIDNDVFIFNDNLERLLASNIAAADIIRLNSDEILPFMHRSWRLRNPSKENITNSFERNLSLPPLNAQPLNYYAASFPTLPTSHEAGGDLFETVNLMEMASEITKRLFPKRKLRQRHNG